MRVTNSMMINNMMRNMNLNLTRMEQTQQQLASGKRFTRPSEDPIGVSRSLRLNTEVAIMDQYKRNAEDSQSWLDTAEVSINNMVSVMQRARELTVQGASGTNSPEDRQKISDEIKQLRDQLVGLGNTTYAGSYLFTGYKTDKPLLNDDGTYDIGGTLLAPNTLSNKESININIGMGDAIGINTVGQKLFGYYTVPADLDSTVNAPDVKTGDKSQLIEIFDQLVNDLSSNNSTGIDQALSRIDIQMDNINAVRAEIGVKTNRIELTLNRIEDDTINLTGILSKNEDADMAQVIMNLKAQENVYQASLSGGAKIIQPSLVDFLR